MKKVLSVIMAMALSLSLLTACGGEEAVTYDVNEVANKITEAVPMAMAMDIPEAEVEMLITGITADDYVNFVGKMSMANVSSDRLIVVEAAEGKVDAVKAALEGYRDATAASFELYLEDQYQKALNGRVVVKGNYVVLAILGDNDVILSEGVEKAYEAVDAAIDAAFN